MSVVVSPMSAEVELTKEELKHISSLFKLVREDHLWIAKNYEKLRENYPDRYIAVRRKKILRVGKDISTLISNLKKDFGDIGNITIEYMGKKPLKLLM